ncbi:1,2-phenylacetyl-CoA epoxidase subunit PaaD [Allonocardiopsis opalescens]|uniref:Ring-1,2-phenylacetyl-CoA epoxidase subunit PaaD n=1 Tax=Allonocardiopsis opalescens TaxID=1144618 RepID=A0A2T0Q9J8_9ACTN|nr:1,2-phenylacetyl-CoA epoxidase subunit PaaD [Allonocardiopsis opalescens]PRY00481.1 ring-1,2-phenylacetyl-CoA epoxidase subunit PaaD [Allonocardiopsis opalescens]
MTGGAVDLALARRVAGEVVDPELPMLTLDDLGILRDVRALGGEVVVTVTPTYAGCPALGVIAAELRRALAAAGFGAVRVRTVLAPPWSSDWISAEGRRKLVEHGVAPPGPVRRAGPVPLELGPRPAAGPACPRCGARATEELSRFGATPCTALHRCRSCLEPFEHVKEV